MEGHFNNLSQKLLESIPKLEDKQVITIQMLKGSPNNHPEMKERERHPVIFENANIPLHDRIKDPYTGKWHDIGLKESRQSQEGTIYYDWCTLSPWKNKFLWNGRFTLIGGHADDEDIYKFLFLANFNRDNPNRDNKEMPWYYIVDPKAEAKVMLNNSNALRTALNLAADMTLGEMKELAFSLMWPSELTDDMLLARVNEYATSDPKGFVKRIKDPSTRTKSVLKQAQEAGVIKYDAATGKVVYGKDDVVLAALDKNSNASWVDMMADFIKLHPKGNKIFEGIKNQLNSTESVE